MLTDNYTSLAIPHCSKLTDDPVEILRFAIEGFSFGRVAIATLVEIRGGAARALGAQIAIWEDGSYCGYVSGGCIEAAVAAEALEAMVAGADRNVRFGVGSPFFDIVLPCGGAITVAIHVLRDAPPLLRVLDGLAERKDMAIRYDLSSQKLFVCEPYPRTGWLGGDFITIYRPAIRLIVSSRSIEALTVSRLATAAELDVVVLHPNQHNELDNLIDAHTAVAILHHDIEAEIPILTRALRSPAFYLGALGSSRTHKRRCERLRAEGFSDDAIDRIKAPIGMFGPTRDSRSLALSVVADVSAARLATFG